MINLRNQIDQIDDQIVKLYNQRMEIVKEVAIKKQADNNSINDPFREKNIINRVTSEVDADIKVYTKHLFDTIFDTSKAY
ncbi:MAG: chorismate mutase, partial [Clostridia bacterium]